MELNRELQQRVPSCQPTLMFPRQSSLVRRNLGLGLRFPGITLNLHQDLHRLEAGDPWKISALLPQKHRKKSKENLTGHVHTGKAAGATMWTCYGFKSIPFFWEALHTPSSALFCLPPNAASNKNSHWWHMKISSTDPSCHVGWGLFPSPF